MAKFAFFILLAAALVSLAPASHVRRTGILRSRLQKKGFMDDILRPRKIEWSEPTGVKCSTKEVDPQDADRLKAVFKAGDLCTASRVLDRFGKACTELGEYQTAEVEFCTDVSSSLTTGCENIAKAMDLITAQCGGKKVGGSAKFKEWQVRLKDD